MALTKELLVTYRDGLQQDYQRLVSDLQAVSGGIQVVDKLIRYLEFEEGGVSVASLSDLGVESK